MAELHMRVPCVTWKDPLVDVGAPETEEEARIRVLTNSYWCAGLRAGVPEELPIFRFMLGRGYAKGDFDLKNGYAYFKKDGKAITRGTSTCALVAGTIWQISGAKVPWAGEDYRAGTAVSRIFQWSSKAGIDTYDPEPGDLCLIGSGMQEHVCVFVDRHESTLWTVDGGQVDAGHKDSHGVPLQAIKHVERVYEEIGSTKYFGTRPLVRTVSVRKAFEKGLFGPGKVAVKA